MTLVSGMTPGGDCHDGILDRQHNQRDRLGSGLARSVSSQGQEQAWPGHLSLSRRGRGTMVMPPHEVIALTLRLVGHSLLPDPGTAGRYCPF